MCSRASHRGLRSAGHPAAKPLPHPAAAAAADTAKRVQAPLKPAGLRPARTARARDMARYPRDMVRHSRYSPHSRCNNPLRYLGLASWSTRTSLAGLLSLCSLRMTRGLSPARLTPPRWFSSRPTRFISHLLLSQLPLSRLVQMRKLRRLTSVLWMPCTQIQPE